MCPFQLGKSYFFKKADYLIFQKASARTSHLAAMEKATENLSALESNLLRLTQPGGCNLSSTFSVYTCISPGRGSTSVMNRIKTMMQNCSSDPSVFATDNDACTPAGRVTG